MTPWKKLVEMFDTKEAPKTSMWSPSLKDFECDLLQKRRLCLWRLQMRCQRPSRLPRGKVECKRLAAWPNFEKKAGGDFADLAQLQKESWRRLCRLDPTSKESWRRRLCRLDPTSKRKLAAWQWLSRVKKKICGCCQRHVKGQLGVPLRPIIFNLLCSLRFFVVVGVHRTIPWKWWPGPLQMPSRRLGVCRAQATHWQWAGVV